MRKHPEKFSEADVAKAREIRDQRMQFWHRHLVEGLLALTEEERPRWRDFVPEIEFWSRGDGIGHDGHVRHPGWPWGPQDAIGRIEI